MNRFRAVIIIEQRATVEVEALNLPDAEEAIRFNQGEQIGEPTYQTPRIESLEEIESD
jgi:hypothetical protein